MSKYLQDQRGIGLVIVIVLVAVIGAAAAFGVMNVMKAKDSGGGASLIPGKVTLNGDCEYKDPDLCKFVNNWQVGGNYTMEGTSKDGNETGTVKFAVAGDDSEIVFASQGKDVLHTITIGKTTYTKDITDGKWWKSENGDQPSFEEDFKLDPKEELSKPEAERTKYTKIGKEACGSLTCFKYQAQEPGDNVNSFIYFDDRDYKLRRMVTTATLDAAGKDQTTSDLTMNYNKPSIKVPSPIKEGNPYGIPTAQ
jgi:hypothetical protein